MKTLLLFLALTQAAIAAPFLTADPYVPQNDPNLNPVSFVITGIGANGQPSNLKIIQTLPL